MKMSSRITAGFLVLLMVLTVFASVSFNVTGAGSRAGPTLTSATVAPSTGNNTTTFYFRVSYMDADNDAPSNLSVVIDGNWFAIPFSGSNFTFPRSFQYVTKLTSGRHLYYFWVKNVKNETARNPTSGTYSMNVTGGSPSGNPPVLSGKSVSPSSPINNQTINFTIQYKDVDNDAPSYVKLHVQLQTGSRSFTSYNMIITGTTYSSGVTCYKTLTLAAGSYDYYFTAASGNDTVSDPVSGYHLLTVSAPPPGPPKLMGGTVSPATGTANTTMFTYSVNYDDDFDDKAIYSFVKIDGINYNMDTNGTSDNSYDGITYYYSTYLPAGNHEYNFIFYDGRMNVTLPTSGLFNGPQVSLPNPPSLIGGSVSPMNGTENETQFTYSVIYQDGNFGFPASYMLYIDNIGYKMVEVQNDTGSQGISFTYSTYLLAGDHTHFFVFSDGNVNVRLPSTGVYKGPYVMAPVQSKAPVVSININPKVGDLKTTFYINGTITDPDNDAFTYYWTFSDNYQAGNKLSVARVFTRVGNYTITLTAVDSNGLISSATEDVIVIDNNPGPINTPPVLVTNLNNINTVSKGSSLYLSALKSYDLEKDPLTFKWIITHGYYNYSTIRTLGEFNYTFDLLGDYTIVIAVSDGKDDTIATYVINCVRAAPNQKPVAVASVTVFGMTAELSASNSYDNDGHITIYTWKIDGRTYYGEKFDHTYSTAGYKTVTLTVTDDDSETGQAVLGFYIGRSSGDPNNKTRDYNQTSVGSHVELASVDGSADVQLGVLNSEPGFWIQLIESRQNYLKFLVEAESPEGRLVVLDIKSVIKTDSVEGIFIKMDDEYILPTNFESVLSTTGDQPMYFILAKDDYYQVLVYIPHFSSHTLEVEVQDKEIDPQKRTEPIIDQNFQLVLVILVVVLVVLLVIGFFQVREKKKYEYYNDFRVAGDRVQNGAHTPTDAEEKTENWDDYI